MPSLNLTMTVTGTEALKAALIAAGERAPRSLTAGLYQEAETIMAKSKELVPVMTGALRASGTVIPPAPDSALVEMGYGGAAVPYAVYVHENTAAKHRPPTKAKFLEQPANEAMGGMSDRLAVRVRAATERL